MNEEANNYFCKIGNSHHPNHSVFHPSSVLKRTNFIIMLFAIICIDRPGSLEIRKANREAHLAHIQNSNGAVQQAGPFLDESADGGGQMCGSLIIFQADDISEARAWADADPYKAADLFSSVEIRPWNRVVGN
jgi:hypothetical protein